MLCLAIEKPDRAAAPKSGIISFISSITLLSASPTGKAESRRGWKMEVRNKYKLSEVTPEGSNVYSKITTEMDTMLKASHVIMLKKVL
jgi:hypothetical protein